MTRSEFNDAHGSFHNELKLVCALPPEGGGAAGEGEVGMETGAYTVNMLTQACDECGAP